jgi:hypothetical protein
MAREKIHEWAMAAVIFNTAYWRQSVGKAADARARQCCAERVVQEVVACVVCDSVRVCCVCVACVVGVCGVGDDGLPEQEGRRVQPPNPSAKKGTEFQLQQLTTSTGVLSLLSLFSLALQDRARAKD